METVVAMAVLSIGIVTIHRALHQAALTRAQARDMTQARFLLERRMAELKLQPFFEEGTQSGGFGPDFPRFQWQTKVSEAKLPDPVPPDSPGPPELRNLKLPAPFLGKLTVTVRWTTAQQPYEESLETLISPDTILESSADAPAHVR